MKTLGRSIGIMCAIVIVAGVVTAEVDPFFGASGTIGLGGTWQVAAPLVQDMQAQAMTDLDDVPSNMPWSIAITEHEGQWFRGRLSVAGERWFRDGVIEGEVSWPWLSGTVTGDDGNTVGTFAGSLTLGGIEGEFTSTTGEVRTWVLPMADS